MNIQESGEMYLETILILSKTKKDVRSLDIAEYMGFSKPSISRAVGKLKKDDYIIINDNGFIYLTDKGLKLATKIYERHQIITKLLESIGVDHDIAEKDACKIEHDISDKTFNIIKNYEKTLVITDKDN